MKQPARNLGVSFKKDGSLIRLSGYIDEFADYAPLLLMPPPLRLVLGEIVSVNSHGIRKWIKFIQAYGLKTLELYECPPVFIDAANMIPDAVSATGNMKRIKSLIIPYSCNPCRTNVSFVLNTADVRMNDGSVVPPERFCARCGQQLDIEVEAADHFLFMTVD